MDINCPNLNIKLNNQINCSVLALSQNKNDSFNLQFDDEAENYLFHSTDRNINYFGLYDRYNLMEEEISTYFTGNFLLLSTEFKFDSFLVGFELYAINPGNLSLYVIHFYKLI